MKTSTGQNLEIDELFTIGEDIYEGKTFPTVKIFGWNVWRVFRDQDKNILKIVLVKDGIFKEFSVDINIEYSHDRSEIEMKKWSDKLNEN